MPRVAKKRCLRCPSYDICGFIGATERSVEAHIISALKLTKLNHRFGCGYLQRMMSPPLVDVVPNATKGVGPEFLDNPELQDNDGTDVGVANAGTIFNHAVGGSSVGNSSSTQTNNLT